MHIVNANGQVACRSTVETLWLLVTVINADYMVLTSYHAQLLGPQVLLFIVPIIPCGSSTSFSKTAGKTHTAKTTRLTPKSGQNGAC